MANELIAAVSGQVTVHSDKDFAEIAGGSDFFARVQLMSFQSKMVQEEKVKAGEFIFVKMKDQFTKLGTAFDCLIIAWHPKALRVSGEEVMANYDLKSEEFAKIRAEATANPAGGCMYGPEFLLWLPAQNDFATYHMSNATARREAANVLPLLYKAASISSKLIVTKKYRWHGPVATECSSFTAELPPQDVIQEKANKFLNPKVDEREAVTAGEGDRG